MLSDGRCVAQECGEVCCPGVWGGVLLGMFVLNA